MAIEVGVVHIQIIALNVLPLYACSYNKINKLILLRIQDLV